MNRFKTRWFDKTIGFMAEVRMLDIQGNYAIVRYSYADEYTPDEKIYTPDDEIKISDGILMQCTGVADKNGKLVFEGDILKCSSSWFKTLASKVIFSKGSFVIEDEDLIPLSTLTEIEIIGNIYENY